VLGFALLSARRANGLGLWWCWGGVFFTVDFPSFQSAMSHRANPFSLSLPGLGVSNNAHALLTFYFSLVFSAAYPAGSDGNVRKTIPQPLSG